MHRILLIAALLLAACSRGEAPPTPLTEAQSAALRPADPRLAKFYEGSCMGCHTVKSALAPLAGDRTLWDPRWAKGEAVLLTNAQTGFGGMPAGGQCFECAPDDLKALIRFMAGRDK